MNFSHRRAVSDDAGTARVCGPECRYRIFFEEGAADAVLVFSATGKLLDVNKTGCEQFGLSREELLGWNMATMFVSEERTDKDECLVGVMERKGRGGVEERGLETLGLAGIMKRGGRGETLLATRAGLIPVEINARRFICEGQDMVLVVARNIAEYKIQLSRLTYQTVTDPLTGINNRRGFQLKAQQEFSRFKRYGNEFAMLMLDLDHFKRVNDTYGHQIGDDLLWEFARRMRAAFRNSDILGRIGGEEFCVLLLELETTPGATGEIDRRALAVEAAERLRKQVEDSPLRKEGFVIPYTVSIGLSMASESDADLEEITRRADAALYLAKSKGRNRVEFENAGENGDKGSGEAAEVAADADLEKILCRVDTAVYFIRRRIRQMVVRLKKRER
jgi:diguanylate cyclase (GGDEF)-like protein